MIQAMKKVIKNVKLGVESTLMYRWYKEADPVYDDEGNLEVWVPDKPAEPEEEEIDEPDYEAVNPALF